MKSLMVKIKGKLSSYKIDQRTRAYIKHNFHNFSRIEKTKSTNSPEVLFELNNLHSSHISYSYLANVLASKFEARIVAFNPSMIKKVWRKIDWSLSCLLSRSEFAVYRSFGVSEFLLPKLNVKQSNRAKCLSKTIYEGLKEKCP